MSPEALKGEVHDSKQDDLFALGVVLYIMATGSHPFRRACKKDKHYSKILNGKNKRLPSDMNSLFQKLIAYKLSDRLTISEIRKSTWLKQIDLPEVKIVDLIFEDSLIPTSFKIDTCSKYSEKYSDSGECSGGSAKTAATWDEC